MLVALESAKEVIFFMKNTISIFKESSSKLKNISCLTVCSMLIALSVVLGSFSIQLSQNIRISFTFIPIAIAGYLFGPIVAGLAGGSVDIINFLLHPTGPFAPGLTLCAILAGVVHGLFLYRKPLSILRVGGSLFINTVFISVLLRTYILSLLYGMPFVANLITRLPVQAIKLPINILILYVVLRALIQSNIFRLLKQQ